jgi:hypothetical protein
VADGYLVIAAVEWTYPAEPNGHLSVSYRGVYRGKRCGMLSSYGEIESWSVFVKFGEV